MRSFLSSSDQAFFGAAACGLGCGGAVSDLSCGPGRIIEGGTNAEASRSEAPRSEVGLGDLGLLVTSLGLKPED